MWTNYLKTALRNLRKNRIDSAISIGGLSLGIACCILLVLFVHFEWSFDRFHEKSDRIYRVVTQRTGESGNSSRAAASPYEMGPELTETYPAIEQAIRTNVAEVTVRRRNEYQIEKILFAENGFFELFSFPLHRGSPASALDGPDKVVLTETRAQELFGTTDVIGETVTLKLFDEFRNYRISGVAADPPPNSSLAFGIVMPYERFLHTMSPAFRNYFMPSWTAGMAETYVVLNASSDPGQLQSQFPAFVRAHFPEDGVERVLQLQPVTEIYLEPDVRSSIIRTSSPLYSWILGGIAVVVLIIACINFMSLTLSKSTARLSEIGIRKSAGAERGQLVTQFLGEAVVTCTLSFLIGLFLAELFLPRLQEMVDKPVPFDLLQSSGLLASFGGLLLFSALFTGLYPALVLSAKSVTESLKSVRSAVRIPRFVRGLVVVQFTLTIAFISAAFIMHRQIDFLTGKDLGFEEENLMMIRPATDTSQGMEIYSVFEEEAKRIPGVASLSATYGSYGNSLMPARFEMENGQVLEAGLDVIDTRYLETLKIRMVEGSGFSDAFPAHLKTGVLVNETLIERMGWEDPVGRDITELGEIAGIIGSGNLVQTLLEGKQIIGVIEDYHNQSLHNRLKPQILVSSEEFGGGVSTIWVRMGDRDLSQTIAALEKVWKEAAPSEPFNYTFLTDHLRRQYESESRWRQIVDISSVFAVALACFGLFGLAALSAQRRKKEISIRKVLGATVSHVVRLISGDFLKLVALGMIIAIPVAWYIMNRWLADFAYRIEIGPGIFALAGGAALLIALATVSWQSVKAALANPVDSLRSE